MLPVGEPAGCVAMKGNDCGGGTVSRGGTVSEGVHRLLRRFDELHAKSNPSLLLPKAEDQDSGGAPPCVWVLGAESRRWTAK